MKGRVLTEQVVEQFGAFLTLEEKSEHTIEKYLRDVRTFRQFSGGADIDKETAIAFKQHLLDSDYAVRSVNSMLASINSLFDWLGWRDCRVKTLKTQQQIFCPEKRSFPGPNACGWCRRRSSRAMNG